jgi:abortive infection bacteriophage resistance protein
MKTTFSKSHLSYEEQIKLLKSRNLTISNYSFAIKKLQHLNYYRLSAYFYPFYDEKNRFRSDTKFEDILQLYYFDKELRNLLFYAIEKIEVYIRTQISYNLSKKNGVFAYTKNTLFHDEKYHRDILNIVQNETKRSKEIFVKEFYSKYDEEYLPIWAMVEIISFNTLSRIFSNLNESYRKEIIKDINIKPFVFQRWLHTLTYVRNICAHHSRLWNKVIAIEPMKPKNQKDFSSLNNQKIFFVLTMIEFIFQEINDDEFDLKCELNKLFKKYPKVDTKAMGFCENWEENPIWSDNE